MHFWQRLAHEPVLLVHGLKVIAIVIVAIIVNFAAGRALRRLAARAQAVEHSRVIEGRRAVTAIGLIGSAVRWTIFVIAAVMILREAGIDITPILAGAGIIGLAVGFGSQTLVRDIVSGIFIIIEGQLAVGDKAEINGVYGTVDEMGLRTTRMLSPGGQLRYFPNGAIGSITRYPTGAIPYIISVPAPPEKSEQTRDALLSILADYHAEQQCFAGAPEVRRILDLGTYGPVIQVVARVLPAAKATFEASAAPRVAVVLGERGLAIPPGRQVTVQIDLASADQTNA